MKLIATEFNILNKETQVDVLWNYGIVVAERQQEENTFILYSVDSFYVELHYWGNTLIAIKAFSCTDLLDPYLNDIPIYTSLPFLLG